ncbi:unnamed protein product [Prunus armeniaca]|uniref:Uncharacterized protein n=1 Tax=Prunus armeniaca TaxID=36596 RepID=A0A6J5URW5_PRUAR|nr:unnamed protein product [Prunus armeniaca]
MARLSGPCRPIGSRSLGRSWDGRGLRSQIVWTPVVVLGLNLDRRWLAPFTSIVEPVSAVGVDSVFLMSIVRGRHEQSPGGGSFGCGPFLFLAVTAGLRHTFI